MIRDHSALFACSYVIVLPLLGLLFAAGLLPAGYILVFYALLAAEHLSQEITRLLVTIGKPLAAGILLFARTGGWCYLLVAAYLGGLVAIDLETVLVVWIVADVLALVAGAWVLRELPWSRLAASVNWTWIVAGLRTAVLFLAGTLAVRALFAVDRYFLEVFASRDIVGVYTLYFGICNSLIAFVDAAVFSFRYPRLVALYRTGPHSEFEAARREFRRQTLVAIAVLGFAAAVLVVPVLRWIGKPIYLEHMPAFYLLLAACSVFVIGHIPHFALYAMGRDRSIAAAHIGGFVLFVALGAVLAPRFQLAGVVGSLAAAILFTSGFKQWRFASLQRR